MYRARLSSPDDFDGWRDAARAFAMADLSPADIVWQVGDEAMDLFVKGTFVRRNIKRDAVKARVAPYRDCKCTIWERSRKLILDSQKFVVPMYELDKRGAFKRADKEAVDLVTSQLAIGAAAVRDMVIDAWAASGDMMVGDPAVSMRDILSGKHILRRDDFHYD